MNLLQIRNKELRLKREKQLAAEAEAESLGYLWQYYGAVRVDLDGKGSVKYGVRNRKWTENELVAFHEAHVTGSMAFVGPCVVLAEKSNDAYAEIARTMRVDSVEIIKLGD